MPVDEPLIAEVYVQNQDIGFVRRGQTARVKLEAYPFTKYSMLEGTVVTLSADAAVLGRERNESDSELNDSSSGASPFKARLELQQQSLVWNCTKLPIAAGMRVQAEIRQGERTLIEYLLSPVRRVASEAGVER